MKLGLIWSDGANMIYSTPIPTPMDLVFAALGTEADKELRVLSGDLQLVERCLEGNSFAWETVVNSYSRRIYNLSYRYVNRRDIAEDLTQEILIRIYQNLKTYRPEMGSLQNWILRVARNLIIDHYRQARRFPQAGGSEELEALNIRDDRTPNPQRTAEQQEAAQFLQKGIQALSPELKEAVILRDIEGMAYQEISDLLGVPEGTVKSRINRGRIELTKVLVKRRARAGMAV
jgi:RNA polymerase sigma-70 factor (ECF subfamily)